MAGNWSQEALEARREYYREYRRKNARRMRENARRYWQRVAESGCSKGQARKRQEKA